MVWRNVNHVIIIEKWILHHSYVMIALIVQIRFGMIIYVRQHHAIKKANTVK